MRTNYLRHLANIIDIQWSRPVGGGGGGPTPNWMGKLAVNAKKCSKFEVADKHDAVLDGHAIL